MGKPEKSPAKHGSAKMVIRLTTIIDEDAESRGLKVRSLVSFAEFSLSLSPLRITLPLRLRIDGSDRRLGFWV